MVRISIYTFIFYMTNSVFGIFLPLHFQDKGLSVTEIGIIMSIGPVVSLFVSPLWGYISDKTNQVKRHLIRLMFLFSISGITVFYLDNYFYILLALTLTMFFYSPIQPLSDILTLNTVKRHSGNYGNVRLWGSIGYAIACLMIGVLSDRFGMEQLVIIYMSIAIASILASLLLEEAKPENGSRFINYQDAVSLLSNKTFLYFLLVIFLVLMPSRIIDNFIGLHIKSLGGSDTLVGTAATLSALGEVPFFILIGLLLRKIHAPYLILIGFSIFMIRAICISFITDPLQIAFIQTLSGIALPFALVASMNYVLSIVNVHLKGTALTLFNVIFFALTGITANLIGGMLMDLFSSIALYLACAGVILIGLIMGIRLIRANIFTS